MNENERIKQERDGLDCWDDLVRYSQTGFASIHPDDFLRMRWYGLYQQKPNDGHFMLRIKVPGGILNAEQLRLVASVAKEIGHGYADITTRQNYQFHWLTIHDVPSVLERFKAVGITTSGACGDIGRNVTGCPLAGLDPDELFDATPYVMAVHEFFVDNHELSDLPRKFKLSISACRHHCAQPEINDLAATGVQRTLPDGTVENGFSLRVGGGLSARPFFAKKMNMFIPGDRLVDVFRAVAEVFRDSGNRDNRKKARIKFLVDEWGIEKFEAEVRARLDWTPDPAVEWPEPKKTFRDHIGITRQKQEGLVSIGACVLSGRMTDDQISRSADIAENFGDGVVRTTNQQNLVFTNIPEARVEQAVQALEEVGLVVHPNPIRRSAVACTGNQFCNLALTETKQLIHTIVEHLEKTVALDELIRINLNGCPNSCGQHHIGDIGLQGVLVKTGKGQSVEGYDISLGGRLGADSKFVRPVWRRVVATDVPQALENLLTGYLDTRVEDDDFSSFVDRHSDEELAALMKTTFVEAAS